MIMLQVSSSESSDPFFETAAEISLLAAKKIEMHDPSLTSSALTLNHMSENLLLQFMHEAVAQP